MAERVLWSAENLQLSIGRQVIFDQASLSIHAGERIGLVGRNGCGKSTFMRLVAGEDLVSDGIVSIGKGVRIAILPQEFAVEEELSISDNVRLGLTYFQDLLRRYENPATPAQEHQQIEHLLTLHDAWMPETKLARVLDQLRLSGVERKCATLSGGEKRRVALARAIIAEPDLLLLDEPTNHLDMPTVEWIEDFLNNYRGSCLFVTHDRYFLDRLATRIVELDNGKFFSCVGSYADFLAAKEERESLEDIMDDKRKKFLRSEVEWVRRSPKARLRRNLGRLRRFDELSTVSAPVRTGDIELVIPPAMRLGNKTVVLKEVSCRYDERTLFENFNFEFEPGCRIGIVGANGTGKSSLLNILIGKQLPTSGKVEIAPTVQFNYVDQNKVTLDENKTVAEELGEGSEHVMLGDEKITIWGYLKRFLFEDERINTKIEYLSGGERARLTLAKILKGGGNFLILDEPTNDLDLSSLRLLEEALQAYSGCLLVVSHDRYFLNRVCDGIIAFEGSPELYYTVGDFDYYVEKRSERQAQQIQAPAPKTEKAVASAPKAAAKKLSYKEERELAGMEEAIAEAESAIDTLESVFSSPDFFARDGHRAAELTSQLDEARAKVEMLYARWDELETKRQDLENQ